ncbi:M1 family peptidase [Apibacter sp. B3889]|uniref:M1 family metallopeptidase n=1 Tax=unclassified Apibacter TaxID=2630820 RepID=UPI00132409F2|nr:MULTISPECIES: M1 family metallopeptidase [unclassified Apibacter]MXO34458.1 M1 family peptidase [Apibacter sp. B3883]MXO41411.1 M1 family peptidase [Apibacter sp. B3889]MXP02981.1 M1 family peptidase [Apibacter sp. B3887]MXP07756.1 M1 family peptidase [Apibacter sp. B3935]
MKKIFFICFLTLGLLSNSQINKYYQQQADYKMNIDVDVKNYQYKGHQQITYTNNSQDTLSVFYFHLYWNAFQPNSMMDQKLQELNKTADKRMITGEGKSRISSLKSNEIGYQKIKSLKQEGIPVTFTVEETILKVQLAKPILPHTTTHFEMEWTSQTPPVIRRAGRNNSEGIDLTMTQWYPKVVEYDYEGWHTFDYIAREFQGVFGNYDVTIAIDKNYIIGAGGVLQNPKDVKGYLADAQPVVKKNKTFWHFKAENIHDFAWAADPDYTVDSISIKNGPLVYLIYQKSEQTNYWEESKPYIKKYFSLMKENFGAYPYPTYSFIQGGDGGMEYGMCTMIMGNAKSLEGLADLMFHEASHSWFQHILASNESMRAWMDEGFTSYAEHLMMAKIFPDYVKNYPTPHYNSVEFYTEFIKTRQEEVMGIFSDHFLTNNGYSVAAYIKGELFLVQLEYIVGRQTFFKIMKNYFETWKFKHPTDRDFIHIAQKISGMDLKWYWNYMTYTTRTIDYAIKSVEKEGKTTKVTLENLGYFPMPIDVNVTYSDGSKQIYNIPLNMMHNYKKQESDVNQKNLPYWKWTQKEYEFSLDVPPEKIKSIEIDTTNRMADINRENNIYPK